MKIEFEREDLRDALHWYLSNRLKPGLKVPDVLDVAIDLDNETVTIELDGQI